MKKSFITAVLVSASLLSFGQGNFYSSSRSRSAGEPKVTGYTYTNSRGEKMPVYVSDSGRYFVIMTSKKTGKTYRKYLTK
jgi:hypothetical protein